MITIGIAVLVISVLFMIVMVPHGAAWAASSLSLSPSVAPAGTAVKVSGSGFAAYSTVTLKYDGAIVATSPASVTTSRSGSIPSGVTFDVPSSSDGAHTVTATDLGNAVIATISVRNGPDSAAHDSAKC